MKRPKALVFQCLEYERAHTRSCLVIRGDIEPVAVPLVLNGREFPVGTRFARIGSRKTSAGFEEIDLRGFEPLEYVGRFENLDGELVLFRQGDRPAGGFFAWHPSPFGLMWGTDASAGRVIEGNVIELAA